MSADLWSRIRDAAERLRAIDSDDPRSEAEHRAVHALGLRSRGQLLLREAGLSSPESDAFERLLQRRLGREPLQYILESVPFRELDLAVGPGVLIPRPETEVLVERVLHWIDDAAQAAGPVSARSGPESTAGLVSGGAPVGGSTPASVRRPDRLAGSRWIVDVGTGSGAILLGLLNRLPEWRGVGIDRSWDALEYARRNLDRHPPLRERAVLVCADLLAPLRPVAELHDSARVSAIVSNPPYIPTSEVGSLAPEVRDHEPRIALDGGEDGLVVVRAIVDLAPQVLEPSGLLAFELSLGQPRQLATLLEESGFEVLEVFHDLTGRERGVIARKRSTN